MHTLLDKVMSNAIRGLGLPEEPAAAACACCGYRPTGDPHDDAIGVAGTRENLVHDLISAIERDTGRPLPWGLDELLAHTIDRWAEMER